jgi:hypothetical protein
MEVDKQEIIQWMDQERMKIAKWANLDSLKIVIYECTIKPIDLDDVDWRTELQRSGVKKLSVLEIEALNLVKYELERRMAQD